MACGELGSTGAAGCDQEAAAVAFDELLEPDELFEELDESLELELLELDESLELELLELEPLESDELEPDELDESLEEPFEELLLSEELDVDSFDEERLSVR